MASLPARRQRWRPWILHDGTLRSSVAPRRSVRRISTQAVLDGDITKLASKPIHPLTLADFVKYGKPPLSAQALFKSANFTLSILPSRLAQRIQALRNLPFIVVTNPNISRIHGNYMHSLSTLLPWSQTEINTEEDEKKFTEVMADLVQTHADTIPVLARGFLESRKYISPKDVTKFLDEHLRARIGTRLIAEQHLALHLSSQIGTGTQQGDSKADSEEDAGHGFIGVIDTGLCPADTIRHCESTVGDICEFKYGIRPSVVINGEPSYRFAQIPVHLEYIITELLKNAFRATIENRMERQPVEITIAPLPDSAGPKPTAENQGRGKNDRQAAPNTLLAQSSPGVTIRIRDRGGGISPQHYKRIWNYSFTTFNEEEIRSALLPGTDGAAMNPMDGLSVISTPTGSSLAGLGYGLPLGRAYAEYFGGGIDVQSLWGWGTDVYLSLKGVGKVDVIDG